MQMARRMLNVLEGDKFLAEVDNRELYRRATLCAALLHDVGHGPFSHVFEEVTNRLGNKIDHEEFTRRLIEETEISGILSGKTSNPPAMASQELLDLTLSFFKEEPGRTAYSAIISSQLDADRLDFIMRDRYFSGVRFGGLDLEWLFDSLIIDEVPFEEASPATQFGFVISKKGRTVIEEFLSSYAHMYTNVYFHKTTRGIEIIVKEILFDLLSDEKKISEVLDDEDMIKALTRTNETDCETYMRLDDSVLLGLISKCSRMDLGKCSSFSDRFLSRSVLRCFEPPKNPTEGTPPRKIGKFIRELESQGLVFYKDVISSKGYKHYGISSGEFLKNILVESQSHGEPTPIGMLNPSVTWFADPPTVRFYFENEQDRARSNEIWNELNAN